MSKPYIGGIIGDDGHASGVFSPGGLGNAGDVPSLELNFDGTASSYRRTSTSPTAAKANGDELATDIISCTRSTTATYVNSSGLLATAAANVPRVEFDGNGNPLGLLVEESRTNYLWLSDIGDEFSIPSTSSTTGPDGSTGNYVPQANGVSDRFQWFFEQGHYPFIVNDKVTVSWYVKRLQGTPSSHEGELDVKSLVGFTPTAPTPYKIADLANGWERWAVDLTVTQDSINLYLRLYIGTVQDDGTGTSTFNAECAYYGFQLEIGEGATSYIPNNGAAPATGASGPTTTRDDDHITLSTSNFGYNGSAMTSVCEATLPHPVNGSGTPRIYEISDGTDAVRTQLLYPSQASSNLSAQWRDDVNGTAKSTNIVAGFTYPLSVKAAVRTDGTTGSYAVDGVVGGGVLIPSTTSAVTQLTLGSTGTAAHIVAHIRRFTYFPRALSDASLAAYTSDNRPTDGEYLPTRKWGGILGESISSGSLKTTGIATLAEHYQSKL